MEVRRTLASAFAASAIAACSLLTPLDGFVTTEVAVDAASDATADAPLPIAPADAVAPIDTGADTKPRPANIHSNPGFSAGCEGWGSYQGEKLASAEGREAPGSCRFCGNDPTFFSGDDASFVENPAPGTYHLEGWVRSAPERPVPAKGVNVFLRTTNFGNVPFAEVEKKVGPLVPLTATWQKLEIDLTVTKTAGHLNAVFAGEGGPIGACFLLDDVYAYRVE